MDDVTALRDALVAALPSRYFHREDMDNLDVLAALDALIAAVEARAALATEHRWQDCTAGQDCPQPQCNPDDDGNCRACGNPFIAAVEARAALTPERLVVAVVDALMAEEVGDGHYRWQFENIVRPAILAALPRPDEPVP